MAKKCKTLGAYLGEAPSILFEDPCFFAKLLKFIEEHSSGNIPEPDGNDLLFIEQED